MSTLLEKVIMRNKAIRFNKCGHHPVITFTLTTEKEYENYIDLLQNGINDYCDKCKAENKEFGLIRVLQTGDIDTRITHFTFNHADIRKVVRYFWKHQVSLHDEYYNINSPYDCTGKCFQRDCKVKKLKKHITVRFTYHYDL